MGKHPRIGLLLGAAACLVAVLFDWVVVELSGRKPAIELPAPTPRTLPAGTVTAAAPSA
ncbi:MAG: hypothetical protein WCC38_08470 [Pseudonocardiaceae bacterium]